LSIFYVDNAKMILVVRNGQAKSVICCRVGGSRVDGVETEVAFKSLLNH